MFIFTFLIYLFPSICRALVAAAFLHRTSPVSHAAWAGPWRLSFPLIFLYFYFLSMEFEFLLNFGGNFGARFSKFFYRKGVSPEEGGGLSAAAVRRGCGGEWDLDERQKIQFHQSRIRLRFLFFPL